MQLSPPQLAPSDTSHARGYQDRSLQVYKISLDNLSRIYLWKGLLELTQPVVRQGPSQLSLQNLPGRRVTQMSQSPPNRCRRFVTEANPQFETVGADLQLQKRSSRPYFNGPLHRTALILGLCDKGCHLLARGVVQIGKRKYVRIDVVLLSFEIDILEQNAIRMSP